MRRCAHHSLHCPFMKSKSDNGPLHTYCTVILSSMDELPLPQTLLPWQDAAEGGQEEPAAAEYVAPGDSQEGSPPSGDPEDLDQPEHGDDDAESRDDGEQDDAHTEDATSVTGTDRGETDQGEDTFKSTNS